jgi:hypothetical protein
MITFETIFIYISNILYKKNNIKIPFNLKR